MQEGYFQALKKAVEKRFRESYPNCPSIMDWKGQDIVLFQEELAEKVQGRLSEKWFYTHIKNSQANKLPRIDLLNMLSIYAGYQGWEDFKRRQGSQFGTGKKSGFAVSSYSSGLIALLSGGLLLILAFVWPERQIKVCFADTDGGEMIEASQLRIEVLLETETTSLMFQADEDGCVKVPRKYRRQKWVVKAPYYRNDTLYPGVDMWTAGEKVNLQKDDYALMIHYFSNASVEDWQKRRFQLDQMIAEEARIFQVMPDGQIGMEMYTKAEFIDKLTTPVNSLRNLLIIETEYRGAKIIGLRFEQKNP